MAQQQWDLTQAPYPNPGSGCGTTDIPFNLRCGFLPTGKPPVSQIDYTWAGDPNTYRFTVKGDAGFGPATWACALAGNRIDCSGQVGLTWITSPFPILYHPVYM